MMRTNLVVLKKCKAHNKAINGVDEIRIIIFKRINHVYYFYLFAITAVWYKIGYSEFRVYFPKVLLCSVRSVFISFFQSLYVPILSPSRRSFARSFPLYLLHFLSLFLSLSLSFSLYPIFSCPLYFSLNVSPVGSVSLFSITNVFSSSHLFLLSPENFTLLSFFDKPSISTGFHYPNREPWARNHTNVNRRLKLKPRCKLP